MDVNLSKAVRSNLLSLQNTATMMGKTQERLATGLKVNSALDNPTNFFTASSLKSRAGDLGQLMDSVSNAVQTIQAADKGISAMTKLVESAQATARQALQTSLTVSQPGTATGGTTATSDLSAVTIAAGDPEELATVDTADLSAVTLSATATTITVNGIDVDLATGDDADAIFGKLEAAAATSSGANAFTVENNAGTISITSASGNDLVIGGDADTLTEIGLTAATTTYTAATGTDGTFSINGVDVALEDGDDAAAILGKLQAAATSSTGDNAFTVELGDDGTISITGTGANDVVIAGASNALAAVGLTAGTNDGAPAGEATNVTNPKRAELVDQYNELLSQIDDLAKDASFNGVNLLNGDDLQVIFNEDGSSKLDITGVTFNSAGLGLSELATTAFDSNDGINAVLTDLKSGIEDLRTQASKFGSNLSVVETRQNFTKDMVNVLETGAANLTLADTNEEAANLLALQTRQQLSSTALSMASQSDQAVLRLF